ncbi:MAG: DJ-1/PfpI family protein [Polyangiales bacterium]
MNSQIGRRTLMQWTASGLAASGLGGVSSHVFGATAQARAETVGQSQPSAADEPAPLHIAMLVYPSFTALDLIGPQTTFSAIEGAQIHLVYKSLEPVPTDTGFSLLPTATFADVPDELEILFVPGGTAGTLAAMEDQAILEFLREKACRARRVTSVCTGSLILGAAGLLKGYRATSHWSVRHLLPILGADPVDARYVVDRNRYTGGGVTSGIDFGLNIVAEIAGPERAQLNQLAIEYAPEPPFDSGTPERAPQAVLALAESIMSPFTEQAQIVAERAARRV